MGKLSVNDLAGLDLGSVPDDVSLGIPRQAVAPAENPFWSHGIKIALPFIERR